MIAVSKVPEEVVLTFGHQIMTGHNKIIDTIIRGRTNCGLDYYALISADRPYLQVYRMFLVVPDFVIYLKAMPI